MNLLAPQNFTELNLQNFKLFVLGKSVCYKKHQIERSKDGKLLWVYCKEHMCSLILLSYNYEETSGWGAIQFHQKNCISLIFEHTEVKKITS